MPRAPKSCPIAGCPRAVTEYGRCDIHPPTRTVAAWTRAPGSAPLVRDAWASRKKRILLRDRRTCYRCGGYGDQVDHVTPEFEGGSQEDHNLACICDPCHRHKSAQEGVRARSRGRR